MLTSSWLFHIFFWSPVPHSALWSPTDHVESLFQVKSLRLFTRLTSNLSLHLGDHSQFLLPFSFTNWSGLHPSRLSSPPVFLFQAGQSRLRWTGYHAPFQRKFAWTNDHVMRGKYIQHNNLASKLCLKYSHKHHVSWNKYLTVWLLCTEQAVPLHPGTVGRNLSWTPFGQNPRCSCPNEKHKPLKEKCGKQFPHWGVISQCYCQHGEMLWRWTKANRSTAINTSGTHNCIHPSLSFPSLY